MNYVLKLLFLTSLYRCIYNNASEDINSLITTGVGDSTSECTEISLEASCKSSNDFYVVEKKKFGGNDFRTYTPTHSNIITAVNYKKHSVWKAQEGEHSKFVRIRDKGGKERIIVIKIISDGSDKEKTFKKVHGFYHESGTIAVNIKDKGNDDFTFTSNVANKNGENTYTPKDNKKIALVFSKSFLSTAQLFWKATGNWYCTKVKTTIESDNLVKITLDTTDGSNTSEVVLIDQGDGIWIPDKTVYLDIEKKGNAKNCKYSAEITNKNGSYTYEPIKDFDIIKVSEGDKVVWESTGDLFCTKVTGKVESDKTTRLRLDFKDSDGKKLNRVFCIYEGNWIEGTPDNNNL
ncbi:uncharacterized protein TA15950 [Theileria annulata]|uniref:Uncharacterized protein n=1 Tax=Theileria annulata TaxID=5874 RepID=Q4UFS1_THEAN|nr:uncharacterized protein TA15950 [Theileria annulata]CAI74045.1 hypothetical protein TA15950 [Theileria annulata]|eukprot:XP_951777.1 hypothetical protein TA15950 [Theileria annulata]